MRLQRSTTGGLGYDALPAGDDSLGRADSSGSLKSMHSAEGGSGSASDSGGSGDPRPQQAAQAAAAAGQEEEEEPGSRAAQVDHSIWHREMTSAGVAAGIAGAFGAPLGGVLFAMEEACSHWSRRVAWRCFLCAAMATMVHAQLSPSQDTGILTIHGAAALTPRQWLAHLPAVVAVSAAGGLLGAALSWTRRLVRRYRRAAARTPARSLAEALVVAALTAAALVGISVAVGTCRPLPQSWSPADVVQQRCPEGQYHDTSTMFFGSSGGLGWGSDARGEGLATGRPHLPPAGC